MENNVANISNKSRSVLPVVLLVVGIIVIIIMGYMVLTTKDKMNIKATESEIGFKDEVKHTAPRGGDNYVFDDGLRNPSSTTKYTLDEMGEGLSSTEVFNQDINNDGKKDRIVRSRYENGTDHFYYKYKIELTKDNVLVDITPDDFRTIESADCSLQKFRFIFGREFSVIKISRPWSETWTTQTIAIKTIYKLSNDKLGEVSSKPIAIACNVSDLF